MGGYGSGRTRYATTPEDRECLKLDVNEFTEILGGEGVPCSGTVSWGDAEIAWQTKTDPFEQLRLQYETTQGGESKQYEYSIPIDRTECHFGGDRPWWCCPKCRTRVGVLYLPPGMARFLCRKCHDVAYTSSRASGNKDRTLRMRYNRIRKKLDADPTHPNSVDARPPDRPTGMHEETYDELISELDSIKTRWRQEFFIETAQKNGWAEQLGLPSE